MALGTVTPIKKTVLGDMNVFIVDVQLTAGANYVDNGEAFDVAQIPGATGSIIFVSAEAGMPTTPATNGTLVVWDRTAKKLVYFQSTTGAPSALVEVAAGTDLSANTARLLVFCK